MGAVGFTCWMIKAPISGYWAVTANERLDNVDSRYFAWLAAKYVARGISTLFLMGLFLKVDARSLPQKNREVRINQFLVPATMLVILGAFLESLIDEHVGLLDSRLRFVSKCSHALFFFDFYLFTFLCLSFISSFRSFFFGGGYRLVVFRSTRYEIITLHYFHVFFIFIWNAIFEAFCKTA